MFLNVSTIDCAYTSTDWVNVNRFLTLNNNILPVDILSISSNERIKSMQIFFLIEHVENVHSCYIYLFIRTRCIRLEYESALYENTNEQYRVKTRNF